MPSVGISPRLATVESMSIEAWLYVKPAAWAALAADETIDRYVYDNTVTGYWQPFGEYQVYNLPPTDEETLAQFRVALGADCIRDFRWVQGPGVCERVSGPPIPDDVLAVMPDHVEYDAEGQVIGSTPPTRESPRWAHVFLGQTTRRFAGEFTNQFSREFR